MSQSQNVVPKGFQELSVSCGESRSGDSYVVCSFIASENDSGVQFCCPAMQSL